MSSTGVQRGALKQPDCESLSLPLVGNCSLGKTPGNSRAIKTQDKMKKRHDSLWHTSKAGAYTYQGWAKVPMYGSGSNYQTRKSNNVSFHNNQMKTKQLIKHAKKGPHLFFEC